MVAYIRTEQMAIKGWAYSYKAGNYENKVIARIPEVQYVFA